MWYRDNNYKLFIFISIYFFGHHEFGLKITRARARLPKKLARYILVELGQNLFATS